MYSENQNYNQPAVPPLYPMDPCRPMQIMPEPTMPMSHPMPMQAPEGPYMPMPMCPMMNPKFRECARICMMRYGNYPMPMEYPMDTSYVPPYTINMNELNPYYPELTE